MLFNVGNVLLAAMLAVGSVNAAGSAAAYNCGNCQCSDIGSTISTTLQGHPAADLLTRRLGPWDSLAKPEDPRLHALSTATDAGSIQCWYDA
ncbi:hypothetical protein FALBO_12753 [Fusarium albosuccineum]|uniref:Secreted protein n=1 Tax=Fusarium albosuccineum TaxID=1237068 RepID=A0A8H4L033_9HYPO|nr:hypothetical protein FALBO_12753 [Fusarium albosuccineum]